MENALKRLRVYVVIKVKRIFSVANILIHFLGRRPQRSSLQITRDHTVANEMMRKGQLAPEDLEKSHWSNVLVNALGAGAETVVPDCTKW